ncbi:MAG: ABC transporter permease, partial [Phyllobacterium sp.]
MFYASMSALLSHWRRRPMQLAMLLMGLSLATALWSGVQAINAEARASYDRAASMLGQDRLEQLVSADGETIPQQVFVDLTRAGWMVSPVLEGQLRLGAARLHVLGIDPVSLPREAQHVDLAEGD